MSPFEPVQTMPLVLGEDGTIRIAGSRVTLDTIVDEFKQGATAEQIQEDFPSLTLREVYGTIAYYLDHTAEVESYLQRQKEEGTAIRSRIEGDRDIGRRRKRIFELSDHLPK